MRHQRLWRQGSIERFVQLIVVGGLALVAGLWTVTVVTVLSTLWLVGVGLICVGIGALGWGIWIELSV